MKDKFIAIASTMDPFIKVLEKKRSLSPIGKVFKPIRSERLMRAITFNNEPVDCLLFALVHMKNDGDNISKSLAWLNQVDEAFLLKSNPTIWHELSNAIRLDLMTQLNGLRLANVWKSERDASTQLEAAQSASDFNLKDKLTRTHALLTGLLGYHLGHGLEISNKAIAAYNRTLSKTKDPHLTQLIKQRITALAEHRYLNPLDFDMSNEQFDIMRNDKAKLQKFITQCCMDGQVPSRPVFKEQLTHDAYQLAGISVFGGPLALIVIPTVLIGTPVFKIIDRVNFKNDQEENDAYYRILDEANVWIKNYKQNRAQDFCPQIPLLVLEVEKCLKRYEEIQLPIKDRFFDSKLRSIEDTLIFDKYELGDAKVNAIKKVLEKIKKDVDLFKDRKGFVDVQLTLANSFLRFLKNTEEQLKHPDGRYHAKDYESKEYDNLPLADIPSVLQTNQDWLMNDCARAAALAKDIHSGLKAVEKDINETLSNNRERKRSQIEKAEQLDTKVRRFF